MKRLLFSLAFMMIVHAHTDGDSTVLQPNITAEDRWQEYEARRLADYSLQERVAEFFYEWIESYKHSLFPDILFFKNNRVETQFCQELLEKFDLDLSQVTVLSKPLYGTPALTIFNTVVIDHEQMSEFTADEQAFILGHELVHLKKMDWATRSALMLSLCFLTKRGINAVTEMIPLDDDGEDAGRVFAACSLWLGAYLYFITPITSLLSRYQEKRCDIESAKTLGLAQAGASAFEKFRKKWISRQEAPMNPNGIWHQLLTFFGLYHSHPELHDRTQYLLELAEEEKNI